MYIVPETIEDIETSIDKLHFPEGDSPAMEMNSDVAKVLDKLFDKTRAWFSPYR